MELSTLGVQIHCASRLIALLLSCQAMKRVQEIKERREAVFYKNRMKGKKAQELQESHKLLADNTHLIKTASVKEKVAARAKAKTPVLMEEEM